MSTIYKSSIALAISLALSACGGGDGESTPKVVESANVAPQLTSIDTQAVKEGRALTITASATDSDGSVSSYAWSQKSGVAVDISGKDTNAVSFTVPAIEQDETITLTVIVTDNDSAITKQDVTVNLVNNLLPTISFIAQQSLNEKTALVLSADLTDIDGEISTIIWSQVSGKALTLTNTDSASVTINAPQVKQDEVAQLKLTIVDDTGDSSEQLIDFTLSNTHHNIVLAGTANVNGTFLKEADIEFSIKGQSFTTTTDVDGNYSLEIDVDVANEFYNYQLTAQGVDSQSHISLSKTELLQDLLAKSASDSVVAYKTSMLSRSAKSSKVSRSDDEITKTDTDIDAITTSEYEYLQSFVESNSELLDQEYLDPREFRKKYKSIDAQLMMEIAAAFSYAAEHYQQVETSNGMVSLQEYLATIYADDVSKAIFDTLLDEQVDNVKTKASDIFETDITYYTTLASNPGTIRLGVGFNRSYQFNSDQTFIQHADNTVQSSTWLVDGKSITVDTSSWATSANENQWLSIERVYASCIWTPVSKQFNALNEKFKSVQQFTEKVTEHEYCSNDSGVVRDADISSKSYVIGYTSDDMEEWQSKDLAGKTIVFDHYSESVLVINAVDDDMQAMSYQFNVDGSGVVIEDNANFTWVIEENGQLSMTFTDYSIQWLKMYDDRSDVKSGKSIFAVYTQGESTVVYQNMAVTKGDEILVAGTFIGKWDHGFNLSQPTYVGLMAKFFFDFLDDGTGTMNNISADGTVVNFSRPTIWYEENNKLVIGRTYTWDENGWGGWTNCDPRADANCFYQQYRTWEILSKH